MSATTAFIERTALDRLPEVLKERLYEDSKSEFQKLAQSQTGITPTYRLLGRNGPDHDVVFTCGLYLGDKLVCRGTGRTKKEAEQEAARKAIESLRKRASS